tara:strand:- start:456 stop:608 length:153 start_codon:yes stop_codon:yes gene_type:complete
MFNLKNKKNKALMHKTLAITSVEAKSTLIGRKKVEFLKKIGKEIRKNNII